MTFLVILVIRNKCVWLIYNISITKIESEQAQISCFKSLSSVCLITLFNYLLWCMLVLITSSSSALSGLISLAKCNQTKRRMECCCSATELMWAYPKLHTQNTNSGTSSSGYILISLPLQQRNLNSFCYSHQTQKKAVC